MKTFAIIVAGGTGTRMQREMPKQFLPLGGKMVLQYSLEAFYAFDPAISVVIVVHPDYAALVSGLTMPPFINVPIITHGGETRFQSVLNGLAAIQSSGMVAVHDAARPLITADFVQRLFAEASIHGNAVPGVKLTDTIRMVSNYSSEPVGRENLRAMQTPQVFDVDQLKAAYSRPYEPSFTDDAMVMQAAGHTIYITEGLYQNIKITHPADLLIAGAILSAR